MPDRDVRRVLDRDYVSSFVTALEPARESEAVCGAVLRVVDTALRQEWFYDRLRHSKTSITGLFRPEQNLEDICLTLERVVGVRGVLRLIRASINNTFNSSVDSNDESIKDYLDMAKDDYALRALKERQAKLLNTALNAVPAHFPNNGV